MKRRVFKTIIVSLTAAVFLAGCAERGNSDSDNKQENIKETSKEDDAGKDDD